MASMRTGSPSRRIPVGPKAPAAVDLPEEAEVTSYLKAGRLSTHEA